MDDVVKSLFERQPPKPITPAPIRPTREEAEAVDPRELRQRIGIVTQETLLFMDSIHDNIAYGNPADRRGGGGGGPQGPGPRLHHRPAQGLRHPPGGDRLHPVRRPAPAPGHRPGPAPGPAHPDPGRGHQRPGHRERAGRPGGPGGAHAGPHHPGDRPPPLHHPAGHPDLRPEPRPRWRRWAPTRSCWPPRASTTGSTSSSSGS